MNIPRFSQIMTGSGGNSNLPSHTEKKLSETTSYVYPVRSLLSGLFQQAAASDQNQKSPPNKDENSAGISGSLAANTINLDSDDGDTTSLPIRGGTSSARRLSLDLGHGISTVGLQRKNSSKGELSSMNTLSKSKKGTRSLCRTVRVLNAI